MKKETETAFIEAKEGKTEKKDLSFQGLWLEVFREGVKKYSVAVACSVANDAINNLPEVVKSEMLCPTITPIAGGAK